MEWLVPIITQIISGAIGGNIAGAVKKLTMGSTANTVTGGIGGIILGQLMNFASTGGMETMANTVINQALAGGGGGIILTAIIGFIRNMMVKKPM